LNAQQIIAYTGTRFEVNNRVPAVSALSPRDGSGRTELKL
jgi:hypothetical protein